MTYAPDFGLFEAMLQREGAGTVSHGHDVFTHCIYRPPAPETTIPMEQRPIMH